MGIRGGLVALFAAMSWSPSLMHVVSVTAKPLAMTPLALQCPSDMALVGKSCVDRWEATLVEVHLDGTETRWSPYKWPHGAKVRAVSQPGVVPQGYISVDAAWRACKASKKRMCSSAEWVAACKGPGKTRYPYGNAWAPNRCTDTKRTYPLEKFYSGPAMFENRSMIDPRLNQVPNTVGLTGEALACTNANGVHDMVGNLNEWVADSTLHGGFYLDTKTLGEGCEYATTSHSNVYFDYSTGFRCCADAKP